MHSDTVYLQMTEKKRLPVTGQPRSKDQTKMLAQNFHIRQGDGAIEGVVARRPGWSRRILDQGRVAACTTINGHISIEGVACIDVIGVGTREERVVTGPHIDGQCGPEGGEPATLGALSMRIISLPAPVSMLAAPVITTLWRSTMEVPVPMV